MLQIGTQYSEKVGTSHKAIMDKVQNEFEYRVQGEYSKTETEIEELEKELASIPSYQVREKLSQVSAFTTPEMKDRIERLYSALEEKESKEKLAQIEKESQDIIQHIENLFLSIKEPQKRQECLDRLQMKITVKN
jgi:DNA polymerase II small subunit/DNA polymerase delta subunit B